MIELHGPERFPTVALLQRMLREVPEQGTFTMGGAKLMATEQLRRFAEAGLRVPEWTKDLVTAQQWYVDDIMDTVLGRKENHTQGRDIIIPGNNLKQLRRWAHREWWCRFVPSTAEWRIHIFDGRCIARGKKVPPMVQRGGLNPVNPNPGISIRSRRNGWLMRHDLEPSDALRDAARGAVQALGYPYGAVDILETASGPVVLEVNRLPAMDHYTATAYVNAIRKHVGGRKVKKLSFANPPYEGVEVW